MRCLSFPSLIKPAASLAPPMARDRIACAKADNKAKDKPQHQLDHGVPTYFLRSWYKQPYRSMFVQKSNRN